MHQISRFSHCNDIFILMMLKHFLFHGEEKNFKRFLLLSAQVFIFGIFLFKSCSKVLISFTGPKFSRCNTKVVSSAYIITLNFEIVLGVSLNTM